jgi:ssDNA-binding replication factor A large subunit
MNEDEVREINRPYIDVWRVDKHMLRKLWVKVETVEPGQHPFTTRIDVRSIDNDGEQGGVFLRFVIEEPLSAAERVLVECDVKPVLLTYGNTYLRKFKVIDATTDDTQEHTP